MAGARRRGHGTNGSDGLGRIVTTSQACSGEPELVRSIRLTRQWHERTSPSLAQPTRQLPPQCPEGRKVRRSRDLVGKLKLEFDDVFDQAADFQSPQS
jgi:hypothetical protein